MNDNRCPHCNSLMTAVATKDGRTGLKCQQCDKFDPFETDAAKRTANPIGTKAA